MQKTKIELFLKNENETLLTAAKAAKAINAPCIIFLNGELGAGKTTFARGFLQAKGIKDHIKSPTYALVESYETENTIIHHCDFYRIQNPQELSYLGMEDYFKGSICLIEWPAKAESLLPKPDIELSLIYQEVGRLLTISANSLIGENLIKDFK